MPVSSPGHACHRIHSSVEQDPETLLIAGNSRTGDMY